jgi:hypothetical protein
MIWSGGLGIRKSEVKRKVSALLAEQLSFASPKESKQRKDNFLCLDLACRRPYFSLLRQRKGEQKKGEPKAVALRATLRYSRRPGSGANSLRSNKRPP